MSHIDPGTERAIRQLPKQINRLVLAIERLEQAIKEDEEDEDNYA